MKSKSNKTDSTNHKRTTMQPPTKLVDTHFSCTCLKYETQAELMAKSTK